MVKRKVSSEQYSINKRKQAYMKAAGYNVPQDGSWGPWQQSIWNKLTTRPKEYDTTLMGLKDAIVDKITCNDTEKFNPLDQGSLTSYNPKNVDWGKTRRSQNKVVNAVSGTWGPIVAAASAPALVRSMVTAPIATMATMTGGATGGYAVDKASESLTGRDFGTNVAMHTPLTPGLGELLNPGYVAGGTYGNFVGNNLANRGRYTLNYLHPAGYSSKNFRAVPKVLSKVFYEKPPTFTDGRKPTWYSQFAQRYPDAAEGRFQNGLIWAGIPETEAPHPMYIQNADGSYRTTIEGFGIDVRKLAERGKSLAEVIPNKTVLGETLGEKFNGKNAADHVTKGGVGGLHSDYINYGEVPGTNGARLMRFEDEQKLNPQWLIADKIKEKYNIDADSKLGQFIDHFGGKPLDWILGYKPFTYKQNYIHTGDDVLPIFSDPTTGYTPNFMFRGD